MIIRKASLEQFLLLCTGILLCWLFTGCKQGQETPPVPQEKMEQVLLDMHLAETYSQGLGDSTKNKFEKNYDSLSGFYTSILKHYDLSFEDFNKALEWYKKRPAMADTLYGKVLNRLNELKAKENIREADPAPAAPPPTPSAAKADSLNRDSSGHNKVLTTPSGKKDTLKLRPTTEQEP